MSTFPLKTARGLVNQATALGGFTFNVARNAHETDGYAVAVPGHERKLPPGVDLTPEAIVDYMERHGDAFTTDDACLGAWYNGATRSWYLDISRVVPTLDDAIAAGRAANQMAIFDLTNGREITL